MSMTSAPEPLVPTTGWNVLHLFVKAPGAVDLDRLGDAVAALEKVSGQVVTAAILGHKADACVMAVAEDVWALRRLQSAVSAAGLEVVESFVSLTEVSEYGTGAPPEVLEARLHPNLCLLYTSDAADE